MNSAMKLATWAGLAAIAYVTPALAADVDLPHLQKQGTAMQLVVDGRPFLVIGGELQRTYALELRS